MPSSKYEDRTHLDGFEVEIFKLVKEEATSEQWKEWLRVPLEHAAAKGNLDLFTRLMGAGARGEAGWRGCHGRTLLGAAACGKSDKVIRALLAAGAKSDANVLFGAKRESALHVAVSHGAEKASMALMIAGADPNLRDWRNRIPLHLAAEAGHHHVIGILLLKGADVDATNDLQETPLHLAASKGQTLCISELLLGGADNGAIDDEGETPLFKAAVNNHVEAIEELLAAGATRVVRSRNHQRSPLEIAARRGHATIVKVFLDDEDSSSAVDATDCRGWTALHHTAFVDGPVQDNGDTVRVLLEAGADVNAKTTCHGHFTPLRIAVETTIASMGTIRALLEGGANVNVPDKYERTPLHIACKVSCVASVEILLRWGADEKLTNNLKAIPADVIGGWKENDLNDEEFKADNQRICRMLARAPADRSWRRRGWLVLSRSCPTRVQISNTNSSSNISSSNGGSAKVARVSGEESGRDGEETEDKTIVDWSNWRGVVGKVVGLEADGVFRLVVGFL